MELVFLLAVLLFWVSIACTEAWKWRMDAKRPDDHPMVTFNSYHLWRSATTASVMMAALSSPGWSAQGAVLVALAFAAGWGLYERTMSFVEKGDWTASRGKTWVLTSSISVPRIPPAGDFSLLLWGVTTYLMVLVFE